MAHGATVWVRGPKGIRASKHTPLIKQDGSPQSQIPKKQMALDIAGARRIERRFTRVGDQRPQLFMIMIDSAGKRDTILRPSLSLQPNRQSNPCSVRPRWLRSSGTASKSCGSACLHWRLASSRRTLCHRDPFRLAQHAQGLDRRCNLSPAFFSFMFCNFPDSSPIPFSL